MYDRGIPSAREQAASYGRFKSLVGIAGIRMRKFRPSWKELVSTQLRLLLQPHLILVTIFEVSPSPFRTDMSLSYPGFSPLIFTQATLHGFAVGLNVTTSLFLGEAAPLGYGFSLITIATSYLTPIVSLRLCSDATKRLHMKAFWLGEWTPHGTYERMVDACSQMKRRSPLRTKTLRSIRTHGLKINAAFLRNGFLTTSSYRSRSCWAK